MPHHWRSNHGPSSRGPFAWIALALNVVWVPPLGIFIGILDTFIGLACSLWSTMTLAVAVLLRCGRADHAGFG